MIGGDRTTLTNSGSASDAENADVRTLRAGPNSLLPYVLVLIDHHLSLALREGIETNRTKCPRNLDLRAKTAKIIRAKTASAYRKHGENAPKTATKAEKLVIRFRLELLMAKHVPTKIAE